LLPIPRPRCLQLTGRPEAVVGWYHSHPGFGCWLSGTDCNTQQSFEQLHARNVAVVVDPIQSVKGKVIIDAFRLINPQLLAMGQEPRQTTSNLGHLTKPTIAALINGLNRAYYSMPIAYRKNALEEKMLQVRREWSCMQAGRHHDGAGAHASTAACCARAPTLHACRTWARRSGRRG